MLKGSRANTHVVDGAEISVPNFAEVAEYLFRVHGGKKSRYIGIVETPGPTGNRTWHYVCQAHVLALVEIMPTVQAAKLYSGELQIQHNICMKFFVTAPMFVDAVFTHVFILFIRYADRTKSTR